MSRTEDSIAELFSRDTANHTMGIRHDDGFYRQVRFSVSGSLDWFDLITWPYNLIVNGSHGSWHFCRFGDDTEDMFVLFRDSTAGRRINAHYWAEKVRAGEVQSWSQSAFREWLMTRVADLETTHPGVVHAIGEQILDSDEHNLEYEETARYAVACFQFKGIRLSFPEAWEQTFTEFDWKYLWACHAIVWGISQYDSKRAELVAAGEVADHA